MENIVKKTVNENSMQETIVKNPKLINFSEIARQMNVSSEYIRLIMCGKRKSAKRIDQIKNIIEQINKAA